MTRNPGTNALAWLQQKLINQLNDEEDCIYNEVVVENMTTLAIFPRYYVPQWPNLYVVTSTWYFMLALIVFLLEDMYVWSPS